MLRELLTIFRSGNPMAKVAANFTEMLNLALENTLAAGDIYFTNKATPEQRSKIYDQDVRINKLERKIRKRVTTHLSIPGNVADVPYCLLMMSLVKDVERMGDYAKNLSEVVELHSEQFPDDDIVNELREIRREVETSFKDASEVFSKSDRERAMEYLQTGRSISHRCDVLIQQLAKSDYDAATATAVVLGTRYYKRIGAHVLNLLSSVVMPLHKIDYFDDEEFEKADPTK